MVQKIDCLKLINFIENIDYFGNKKIYSKKILIAFSGGQDSTCLLIIFYILSKKWGFKLGVVYCNHCWTNSSKTAVTILDILQKLDLPFYFVEAPSSKPIKPEQKARNWRYSSFESILKWGDYDFLLTGHTLSDCVETTLFNLCRGSGLKGVCSLKESQPFSIPCNENQFIFNKIHFYLPQFSKKKKFPAVFLQDHCFIQDNEVFSKRKKKKPALAKFFTFCSKNYFRNKRDSKIIFPQKEKNGPYLSFFKTNFRTTQIFENQTFSFIYGSSFFLKSKRRIGQKELFNQLAKNLNPLKKKAGLFSELPFLVIKKKISLGYSFLLYKRKFKSEFNLFEEYARKVKKAQETTSQVSVITFFNPVSVKKRKDDHLFFFNSQIQQLIQKKNTEGLLFESSFFESALNKKEKFCVQKRKRLDEKDFNQKEVILLRPLIKVNRKTLFLFLKKLNFRISYDKSNKNLNITRNYIRKVILPLLKKINPQVEKNIYKFSRIIEFYYTEIGDLSCPENLFDFFIL